MQVTKGIRLNNPGNIERGEKWLGLSADQPDARFCKFDAPEYGIRAICKIIRNYGKKYGINTVQGIINRWAPPSENPTGAYVQNVAKWAGVPADAPLDLSAPDVLAGLAKGITRQENGVQPYPDQVVEAGVKMALA